MSLTLARLGIVAGSFPIAADGDFEAISSVTVGSGGAANIEFTSIPATYQHLQVRLVARSSRAQNTDGLSIRLNGISTNTYAYHNLNGDGSSATAAGSSSQPSVDDSIFLAANNLTSTIFAASVIDILDYASSSKNTTLRIFGGHDRNGGGVVTVSSGLFASTAAVTSIRLFPAVGSFQEYSTAALYGVKAP
jgi:hypothetical protein